MRYETSYEFDGMGRMTRERVMERVVVSETERMNVLQDKRTTYDLGGNPTEIVFYDNVGKAFKETRTYARGYQITDATISDTGTNVNVSTSGAYAYDANNNMTATKAVSVDRSGTQLIKRARWSFSFDRKNRLKSYTHTDASNVRGNLWYDGKGRVWQRWNDNSSTSAWSENLKRFVYDGAALIQEHTVGAEVVSEKWVYTYTDINRDYLRHPAGVRQREGGASNYTDHYLQANAGARVQGRARPDRGHGL